MGKAYSENKDQKNRAGPRLSGGRRSKRDRDRVDKKDNVNIVNSFNILFTNADTFTQVKLQELKLRIEETSPLIIAVSEVKPKNFKRDIQLSEYNIDGYEILSANISKNTPGRGMLMYVKDSLKHSPVNIKDVKFDEHLLCEVDTGHNNKILIGSLYRSPSGTEENFQQMCNLFKESTKLRYTQLILFGDLNLPQIDWNTCSTSNNEDSKDFKFIETVRDCFLFQHVTNPTRGRGSDNPSVIDLVFTSEEGVIETLNIYPPLGKSDHSVIELDCKIRTSSDNQKKERYKYDKGDYSKLAELLDINWEEQFSDCKNDVEGQWCKFKNIFEKF